MSVITLITVIIFWLLFIINYAKTSTFYILFGTFCFVFVVSKFLNSRVFYISVRILVCTIFLILIALVI